MCRILLRHSISSGEFVELFKRAYVETARAELGIRGREANKSKIAAATGLSRKEVARLCDELDEAGASFCEVDLQHNRNVRTIHAWTNDNEFLDDNGEPKKLPFNGEVGSFESLIKKLGGDIPVNAMYQEIVRSGAASSDDEKYLTLQQQAFVPSNEEIGKLNILGNDVSLLLSSIHHNLHAVEEAPLFQRKVAFHNVSDEGLELIEKMASEDGQLLLEKIDRLLPQYVCDTHEKDAHYAGLGVFMFKEEVR